MLVRSFRLIVRCVGISPSPGTTRCRQQGCVFPGASSLLGAAPSSGGVCTCGRLVAPSRSRFSPKLPLGFRVEPFWIGDCGLGFPLSSHESEVLRGPHPVFFFTSPCQKADASLISQSWCMQRRIAPTGCLLGYTAWGVVAKAISLP